MPSSSILDSSVLGLSPSVGGKTPATTADQVSNYVYLAMKMGIMLILATLNFLALSISLNCNKFEPVMTRFGSAIYAFFFGFIYILVNYYTYRVMTLGKICQFDESRVFPF